MTCQFRYDCGSHPYTPKCLSLFRRKYFLSTNLVNQILSAHVRQVFANAVDHHHYESAVIYVQPVAAADEFIIAVSYERTVNILAQVWLVKSCHDVCS